MDRYLYNLCGGQHHNKKDWLMRWLVQLSRSVIAWPFVRSMLRVELDDEYNGSSVCFYLSKCYFTLQTLVVFAS